LKLESVAYVLPRNHEY